MKPQFLTKNAKIFLVAPSFGCTTSPYKERLDKSIINLENYGFKIIKGENIYKDKNKAASNTPKKRAKEIMDSFNSDCDAIMSVGGGEIMMEILPYINFKKIQKQKPKWYIGYSDNTNLTYTLTTICDIETVYAIHATSYYLYPFTYDSKDTINLLEGKKEFDGYKNWQYQKTEEIFSSYHFDKETKVIAKNYTKPFEGRLIGGCLDILNIICGTKYDNTINYINKHPEGVIFFLEACDLNSVGIKRVLFQLREAMWFKNVKGFIIGRSNNYYDKSFGITPNKAYIDSLKQLNVPILLDCSFGHLSPSLPIRCGALAKIEYINNNIKVTYKE